MVISYMKAILSLNPNAKCSYSVSFDENMNKIENIDSIVWKDGTNPISKENINIEKTRLENIIEQEQSNKQSSINKLKALGLTDEEVEAFRK